MGPVAACFLSAPAGLKCYKNPARPFLLAAVSITVNLLCPPIYIYIVATIGADDTIRTRYRRLFAPPSQMLPSRVDASNTAGFLLESVKERLGMKSFCHAKNIYKYHHGSHNTILRCQSFGLGCQSKVSDTSL